MVEATPSLRHVPPSTIGELARSILADPDQATLRSVIGKSIAVSSGKGGVGKTITACNLSLYYARKGMQVGLVDLDPLSDVASLLDLYESEQAVQETPKPAAAANGGVTGYMIPVFRGLEILFPFQKLDATQAAGVMERLYRGLLREVDSRYDLLIFDMPAGLAYDDNMAYLAFMKMLVLVTNPEPTAHASAGAYAKEVQRLYREKRSTSGTIVIRAGSRRDSTRGTSRRITTGSSAPPTGSAFGRAAHYMTSPSCRRTRPSTFSRESRTPSFT